TAVGVRERPGGADRVLGGSGGRPRPLRSVGAADDAGRAEVGRVRAVRADVERDALAVAGLARVVAGLRLGSRAACRANARLSPGDGELRGLRGLGVRADAGLNALAQHLVERRAPAGGDLERQPAGPD